MAVCARGSITLVRVDDGEEGVGITSITEYYAVSSSNTVAPDSWSSTTVPVMTETNKYLWNYERVTYSDGSHTDTKKRIIGVYGNKGDAGDDIRVGHGDIVHRQQGAAGPAADWSNRILSSTGKRSTPRC